MKNTNQLLTNVVNQAGSGGTDLATVEYSRIEQPETHADAVLMERIVNDLFIFLKNSYSSFRSTYKTTPEVDAAKREWSRTLIENGVTSREAILIGKSAVRRKGGDWFPGPSDFCKMCIPLDMGAPEITQAYYEAANASSNVNVHLWSHGVVYQAGKQTGWYLLRTEKQSVSQPVFNKIYKDMVFRMNLGEKFASPKTVKTTENRITFDAKKKDKTKTEQNKSARDAFKNSIKF